MAKRRGGGLFKDDITGAWTPFGNIMFAIAGVVVLGLLGLGLYFILKDFQPTRGEDAGPEKHKTGPGTDTLPGKVNIAEILNAPSAGQAILYFSKHEEAGTTCDTCNVQFDVDLTYTGGSPSQPPKHEVVMAPLNSGTVIIPYGQPSSGFSPVTPGSNTAQPPTSVVVAVTARVVSNANPSLKGAATSFSKTIPYAS